MCRETSISGMSAHAALQDKRIKGAALDVFETEPLPEDSPLYELDNCLLSPHCADRTARWDLFQYIWGFSHIHSTKRCHRLSHWGPLSMLPDCMLLCAAFS